MKQSLALLVATLLCMQLAIAQSPQSIPFQAVARDTNGVLIPNQNISVRITIHDGTATGTVVYQESQSVTTNNLGLVTLSIGQGTVLAGTFSNISWESAPKFVQLEVDPTGGTSYTNLGTSQLQSVPYALYASSSSMPKSIPAAVGSWQSDSTFKPNYNLTFLHDSTTLTILDTNNHGRVVSNKLVLTATDGKASTISMATGASSNASYSFPNAHGVVGSVLTDTTGNGNLSWASGGVVHLLGKLIGADMNLASSYTLTYSGFTGCAFQVWDQVNGGSYQQGGAFGGTVTSSTSGTLTLTNVFGTFPPDSTITASVGQIIYTGLSGGPFQSGETVIGNVSGATGSVFINTFSDTINITGISGAFQPGDTLLGYNSGATATVSSYVQPGSAIISSYGFPGADQSVTLTGGSTYIITDIVFTNASTSLTTASDGEFWTAASRGGNEVALGGKLVLNKQVGAVGGGSSIQTGLSNLQSAGAFGPLVTSSNYMNVSNQNVSIVGTNTVASPIYFTLGKAQGSSATVDIYVYGYILH